MYANDNLGLSPELADTANMVGENPNYVGTCFVCDEPFEAGCGTCPPQRRSCCW